MDFTLGDMDGLVAAVSAAWLGAADHDWSARAGTLDWTCRQTADHAVDTVLAPALFLASRKQDEYPAGEPFTVGADATPAMLVDALRTVARVLADVVRAAPAETRAIIWRDHTAPPPDFVPRAGFELALHTHDVCSGLGVPFAPSASAVDHLRQHTRDWPYWSQPGWRPLAMTGDPWHDLLVSSGRTPTASPSASA
jgi:hypothetical protein